MGTEQLCVFKTIGAHNMDILYILHIYIYIYIHFHCNRLR